MAKSNTLAAQRLRSSIQRLNRIRSTRKLSKRQKVELEMTVQELEEIAFQMEVEAKAKDRSAWFKLVSHALVVLVKVCTVFRKT